MDPKALRKSTREKRRQIVIVLRDFIAKRREEG
jgi:hypothetical protein